MKKKIPKEIIIILAHGSPEKRFKKVVSSLRQKFSKCFVKKSTLVYHAFLMFNKPNFTSLLKSLLIKGNKSLKKIIILPLFISQGRHSLRDLPKIIKCIKDEYKKYKNIPIKLALPLGSDDYVVKLLYKRYKEVIQGVDTRI